MEPTEPRSALAMNRAKWEAVAARFAGGTALPVYGPLTPTEETLHLLPDLQGSRVLELGCGSGHSLLYLAQQGAAEVWGLDLAAAQINLAADLLRAHGVAGRLYRSAMEEDPGLPAAHFDLVVSIYALGWTVDLPRTLSLVARYLRPGGVFLFSWEHPIYRCLADADGRLVLGQPYQREGAWRAEDWAGPGPATMQARKLSTYLNGLIDAGLVVERVLEPEADAGRATPEQLRPGRWYSVPRAELVPTTLIVRARKPVGM